MFRISGEMLQAKDLIDLSYLKFAEGSTLLQMEEINFLK